MGFSNSSSQWTSNGRSGLFTGNIRVRLAHDMSVFIFSKCQRGNNEIISCGVSVHRSDGCFYFDCMQFSQLFFSTLEQVVIIIAITAGVI